MSLEYRNLSRENAEKAKRTIEIVRTLSCLFELYELSRKILCPAHSQLYIDILEINMFTRSTLAYLIYKYQLVNFRY